MAQFGRPTSDISKGGFTGVGDTVNFYANIDESVASDTDYNWGPNGTADSFECKMGSLSDPYSSSGHIIRFRAWKVNSGAANTSGTSIDITVSLVQGTTVIASTTVTGVTSAATSTYTLTSTETDSITDYTDLRLRFAQSNAGGSPANRRGIAVSFSEFEIPDPPASKPRRVYMVQ